MKRIKVNDIDRHIVEESDGWYFWSEDDGQYKYGPYKDIEEARNMLIKYDKEVLGN